MSESDQVGPLMIGALVTITGHDVRRLVAAALHAQGFADYRSTYHEVFMLTRAEGSRITELAELAQVSRQAMNELAASEYNYCERFKAAITTQDGFVAGYWLRRPNGRMISLTVWESEEKMRLGGMRANAVPLLPVQNAEQIVEPESVEVCPLEDHA